MEAIRHTGTRALILIFSETEAADLMSALGSNANCPEMDDLLSDMQHPRDVTVNRWTFDF